MTERIARRWWDDVENDPVHVAAADWFVRLQNPDLSLDETMEWQRWIASNPHNAQAFARIERTYSELGNAAVAAFPLSDDTENAADDYDGSLAVGDWKKRQTKPQRHPRFRGLRFAGIAAGVACGTVVLSWAMLNSGAHSDLSLPNSEHVQTAIGENRTRRVALEHGEAFFVVAKDSARPFTVRAGDATVTAVGTQFNVHRRSQQVTVAVVEGRVRVESTSPHSWLRPLRPAIAPVQVSAGEQTFVGNRGIEAAASLADPAAVTSWQTGRLAFHREPLRNVLEDVNRYSAKPIVVANDSIGELKITGTVLGSDVTGWIESLELAFGLTATEEQDRILIGKP